MISFLWRSIAFTLVFVTSNENRTTLAILPWLICERKLFQGQNKYWYKYFCLFSLLRPNENAQKEVSKNAFAFLEKGKNDRTAKLLHCKSWSGKKFLTPSQLYILRCVFITALIKDFDQWKLLRMRIDIVVELFYNFTERLKWKIKNF